MTTCAANMKTYVEIELNEQWQNSKMIRWAWTVESMRYGNRFVNRYHVEISNVVSSNAQPMVQTVPMQAAGLQGQVVMQMQQGQQPQMMMQNGQPVQVVYVQAQPQQQVVQ